MIKPHSTSTSKAYDDLVFATLQDAEGVRTAPYYDSKGIPTIGIGVNLRVASNLTTIVDTFGFFNTKGLTAAQVKVEQTIENKYVSAIQKYFSGPNIGTSVLDADLNSAMANANAALLAAGLPKSVLVRSSFAFQSATEAEASFIKDTLPGYEKQLGAAVVPSSPGSLERAALLSLVYNGLTLNKTQLAQDIAAGNRAEAWYEIRYDSNAANNSKSGSPNKAIAQGAAIRRDFESDLFGLYDGNPWTSPSVVTNPEAVQIFTMVLNHASVMFQSVKPDTSNLYNNQYYYNPDSLVASANTNYPDALNCAVAQESGFQIRSLQDDLAPAASCLLTNSSAISSGDVLVFNQPSSPLTKVDLTSHGSTALAVFIQKGVGGPQITMNAGNDILYSNANDFIVMGSGLDHLTLNGSNYIIEDPGFGPHSSSTPVPLDTITFDGHSIAATLAGSGSINLGWTYLLNNNPLGTTLVVESGIPGSPGSEYLAIEGFHNGDYGVFFKSLPSSAAEVALGQEPQADPLASSLGSVGNNAGALASLTSATNQFGSSGMSNMSPNLALAGIG